MSRRKPLPGAALLAAVLTVGALAAAGFQPAAAQQRQSAAPPPAQAQQQPAPPGTVPGRTFGDWQTRCTEPNERGQKTCEMFQDVKLKESGQRVMHVAIGYRAGERGARAVFVLPLGFSIPGGVGIGIDGREPGKYQVEYCDPGGCRVDVQLAANLLGAMRAGSQGQVIFKHRSGQDLNIPFSLAGFTAAFESLR